MRLLPLASFLSLTLGAAVATPAFAAMPTPSNTERPNSARDALIVTSEGFLAGHPDMRWRRAAQQAEKRGRLADAITYYRRAARFADKPSQAMLAEAYWEGRGVAQDRALAYAWMDLAAERGFPFLIVKRETYWNALSEEERARALEVGAELYAEFGDEVAKPRTERAMRRERTQMTGSRTGFAGLKMDVWINGPEGYTNVDASEYYAEKLWEPRAYWRWQDYEWRRAGGTVEIGDLEVDRATPAAAEGSTDAD